MRLRHWVTGEELRGDAAQWAMSYMRMAKVPIATLDRRAWVWNIYEDSPEGLKKLASYPDTRPYPYPESVRTR